LLLKFSTNSPYFKKFSADQILELSRVLEGTRFGEKQLICREGTKGVAFYVIISGSVMVFQKPKPKEPEPIVASPPTTVGGSLNGSAVGSLSRQYSTLGKLPQSGGNNNRSLAQKTFLKSHEDVSSSRLLRGSSSLSFVKSRDDVPGNNKTIMSKGISVSGWLSAKSQSQDADDNTPSSINLNTGPPPLGRLKREASTSVVVKFGSKTKSSADLTPMQHPAGRLFRQPSTMSLQSQTREEFASTTAAVPVSSSSSSKLPLNLRGGSRRTLGETAAATGNKSSRSMTQVQTPTNKGGAAAAAAGGGGALETARTTTSRDTAITNAAMKSVAALANVRNHPDHGEFMNQLGPGKAFGERALESDTDVRMGSIMTDEGVTEVRGWLYQYI
jgi:hypothetical protein